MVPSGGNGLIASNLCRKGWANDEKLGREPRPVGIGAHLEKNRRTRGLARGNPQQNAQAHQGSRPGRRRGVEVDGHSDLVARRHHLHWRILQEYREAYLRQGRVSEEPARLFNSSLDGNTRRAIDIHEGEEVDESAFKALVRQAVARNSSGKSKPSKKAKS